MKAGTPDISKEAGAAADDAAAEGMLVGAEPWSPASDVWEGCNWPGWCSAGRCAV